MLAGTESHGIGDADERQTVLSAEAIPAIPPMPGGDAATSIGA